MKVLPFVISVIILFPNFAWCNAGLQAPEPAKAPVETADRPYVWEFGVVKEGQVLEHEFNFTNTYGKDLLIKGTTTSCGCTVSEIKKNILKPGEINNPFSAVRYQGVFGEGRTICICDH